jgi:phospholipid/cholesterol/gamma-HCH transport system substrate-binding protein
VVALCALVAAVVVLVALLGDGGDEPYELTAEFENASQLVGGESVVVGGVPVGSVSEIALADDAHALVSFTVNEDFAPLPEGTIATVRSTSLASVANRRVELTLPPPSARSERTLPAGATLGTESTVSEVDLDQVFNTLDPEAVGDARRVIKGLERSGRGVSERANRGFRYLNPLLSSSRRVLAELGTDEAVLEQLIVDTSQLSGALAERAPEISELVGHLDTALGAVGRQRGALAAALAELPAFLREANTTLVNLRAAADDLDPLLIAAKPVAERLGPFFAELRATTRGAVPTLRDLDQVVRRPGADNDLTEVLRLAPALARRAIGSGSPRCGEDPRADYAAAADDDFAQGALGEANCTLRNSLPVLNQLRAYTPELVGWFDDFATSGTIDASGGIGRIAGTFNAFSLAPNGLPDLLTPIDPADLYGTAGAVPLIDVGNNSRCPGANERDPGDGSVPFTDGGTLNCDPTQVAIGP